VLLGVPKVFEVRNLFVFLYGKQSDCGGQSEWKSTHSNGLFFSPAVHTAQYTWLLQVRVPDKEYSPDGTPRG
jgi:hypothetical protein